MDGRTPDDAAPTIGEPEIVENEDGTCAHMMWAMWPDDDDGDEAHIGFWAIPGGIVVQSLKANAGHRGRDMMRWAASLGRPVHVVEVVPYAVGFWERMRRERLILDWEPATGMPSILEASAIAFERHAACGDPA